jgi:hypothetical protein
MAKYALLLLSLTMAAAIRPFVMRGHGIAISLPRPIIKVANATKEADGRIKNALDATALNARKALGSIGIRRSPLGRQNGSGGRNIDKAKLKAQNDANLKNMFQVIDSDGWQHVITSDGEDPVTVWKKIIVPGTYLANDAANDEAAAKFACIKATAVISAPPQEVYKLFLDNSRVNEYNEHCAKLEDVEYLSKDTKIAWSATAAFANGIIKGRDFVTMVHYREQPDGALIAVNRPATHPSRPQGSKYQRAEVLLAGNVIRPVKGQPDKTFLTLITHINPGGIVDNAIGAAITNKMTATSPVEFIRKLEAAARSSSSSL